jgi:predicted Fe-S protein YdhL (DUF1289 family)
VAIYPKIQSPCPYKNDLASIMDGDMCRMCKRQVFDLTHMSDGERVAFMKGCAGEVCVSYRLPVRQMFAAAVAVATIATPMAAAACDATDSETVVVGGIKDPANVRYVQNPADRSIPELPVVYERQAPARQPRTAADRAEPSGNVVNSREPS